ncbi:hypothetical protein N7449_008508 [Penicillium cf. viridicatum]|uniref:Uncharacterized protein n=1 Tax=Penicillium cf. viridicatum TaxID=2972119 RepID=A0A9W9JAK3_9EURO|nr:hypothetical protein N7449_008508 [Penicillium cf. viridicatum]
MSEYCTTAQALPVHATSRKHRSSFNSAVVNITVTSVYLVSTLGVCHDCLGEYLVRELRQAVSSQASARRRLLREASQIIESVNVMMALYANGGMAPATHTIYRLGERMNALLDEIRFVRAEEDFYRDLEREIFAQIG